MDDQDHAQTLPEGYGEKTIHRILRFDDAQTMQIKVPLDGKGTPVQTTDHLPGDIEAAAFDVFGRIGYAVALTAFDQPLQLVQDLFLFTGLVSHARPLRAAFCPLGGCQRLDVFHCAVKESRLLLWRQLLPVACRQSLDRQILQTNVTGLQQFFQMAERLVMKPIVHIAASGAVLLQLWRLVIHPVRAKVGIFYMAVRAGQADTLSGLLSEFRRTRRNQAYKYQLLVTAVAYLVCFIAGDKHDCPWGDGLPFSVAVDLPFTGMKEDFVLPFMLVAGRIAIGRQLEDPHTEVGRPVILPDHDTACNTAHLLAIEYLRDFVCVMNDFHG